MECLSPPPVTVQAFALHENSDVCLSRPHSINPGTEQMALPRHNTDAHCDSAGQAAIGVAGERGLVHFIQMSFNGPLSSFTPPNEQKKGGSVTINVLAVHVH